MPSDIKQENVSEDKTAAKDNVGAGGDASPVKRGRGRPKKDDAAKAKPKIVVSAEAASTILQTGVSSWHFIGKLSSHIHLSVM